MVDGLHLPHLDEPHSHGLGGGLQHSLMVVLCLVQHLQQQRGVLHPGPVNTGCLDGVRL